MIIQNHLILLPVNNARNDHQLVTNSEDLMLTLMASEDVMGDGQGAKRFELYLLSDDKIEKGDWFSREESIIKCFKSHKNDVEFKTELDSVHCGTNTFWNKKYCSKIIATTDPKLIADDVHKIPLDFLVLYIQLINL